MTVQIYRAIDASAPALTGSAGSLANVLEKCLVSGYGSKTAAGWTTEFTEGANRIVFRAPTGHRKYLRVDDDVTALNKLATITAYATMTDFQTGTGLFPLTSQSATGVQILKSDVEDGSGARDWILLANDKIFHLIVNWDAGANFQNAVLFSFGDYISFNASDAYNVLLAGKKTQSFTIDANLNPYGGYTTIGSTIDGVFTQRAYTQIGSSVLMGKHGDAAKSGLQFPNPVDGGIYYSPIWLTEANVIRGILPGLWYIPHSASALNHLDTFDGSGAHAGKTFMLCKYYGGIVALEISDTW